MRSMLVHGAMYQLGDETVQAIREEDSLMDRVGRFGAGDDCEDLGGGARSKL